MTERVGKPWSAQIELTEGCNRLCAFCGLNGIRDAPGGFKFMTLRTADRVASELGRFVPEARYEFAMHGEPLQNPDHLKILATFRGYLPKAQIQVTTNGKVLMRRMNDRLLQLFAVGVDFVILDTYRPERDKLREEARTLSASIKVKDFYDELAPAGWSPYANHRGKTGRLVVLMDDLGDRDGEVASRTIMNHAGSNPGKPPLKEPLNKTCTIPFREINVTWNGNVNVCCMDWRHEFVAGNLLERRVEDVWWGPELEAARAMLQQKRRFLSPCDRCDAGSGARSGLLPKYAPPTKDQLRLLDKQRAEGAGRVAQLGPTTFTKRRLPLL